MICDRDDSLVTAINAPASRPGLRTDEAKMAGQTALDCRINAIQSQTIAY